MSATMDVDHFSKYFNCRVLYLEGRTHPVSVYYSHQNFDDYMNGGNYRKLSQPLTRLKFKFYNQENMPTNH